MVNDLVQASLDVLFACSAFDKNANWLKSHKYFICYETSGSDPTNIAERTLFKESNPRPTAFLANAFNSRCAETMHSATHGLLKHGFKNSSTNPALLPGRIH